MKLTYPSYYPMFRCLGGACTDNCCIGWEIGIDQETFARYETLSGGLGEKVRGFLATDEAGNGYFRMKGNRCPLLNDQNLCELILASGEESLCEICAQHPRFHNWFGEEKESGLGLCCEAAVKLILKSPATLSFIETTAPDSPDGSFSPSPCFVPLKQARQTALDLLQNRELEITQRLGLFLAFGEDLQPCLEEDDAQKMEAVIEQYDRIQNPRAFAENLHRMFRDQAGTPAEIWHRLLEFFLSRQAMDQGWSVRLGRIQEQLPVLLDERQRFLEENPSQTREQTKLVCYFVFRYFLQGELDGDLLSKIRLGVLGVLLIQLLELEVWRRTGALSDEDRIDCIKLFSKEIEYSQENLDALVLEFWTCEAFNFPSLLRLL